MDILNATSTPVSDSDTYRLSSTVWTTIAALTCIIFLSNHFLGAKPEVNEPRFIPSKVPFVGHMFGIMQYKMKYYTMMSQKALCDVFTLPMFGGRLYVLTDPNLVPIVQRHYKELSFWFLEGNFTVKLGGLSKEGAARLTHNAAGREEGDSLVIDGMKATHAAMNSGIYTMMQTAADIIAVRIDEVVAGGEVEVDLWQWIDSNVAFMTSGAVYGPRDPYRDPKIASALKAFSSDTSFMLVGLLPSFIASKGYNGREAIVAAFQKYFAAGYHELGSDLIKARFNSLYAYGISGEDIARFEAVNGFGILINTVPTAFWSIYHVFSDPELLESVRETAGPLVSTTTREDGSTLYTIDVREIREIPLLVAIVSEALRYHTSGAAPRMVMEDFVLDNRYLLKKGSMLMVPNREIHFHKETWGEAVDTFDPSRFTRTKGDAAVKKPPAGAFRGFGSGVNMCPGKNFATVEILSVMVMMALRFDITPVSGTWEYPGDDGSNMSPVITSPAGPVPVKIRPRANFEEGTWVFRASKSSLV